MTYKELMIKSLTDLLEPGEILMHPIYGILSQGNAQYYGYFGLTENYLLIALITSFGKTVANTIRIPLDIKSVKIKKSPIIKQREIDISFNEGAPCKIIASPRVATIGTQKENLPEFISYLVSKAPQTQIPKLKDISGIKIRRQYFKMFYYIVFLAVVMVPLMMTVIRLKENNFDLAEIVETIITALWVGGVFLSPVIVWSLLSRFVFGKIVGVVNDAGVFVENNFIQWVDIKEIIYDTDINYTCATIAVETSNDEEYTVDIMHFPAYGLRKIKKCRPETKIKLGKNVLLGMLLRVLIPVAITIVIPFIV